MSSTPIKRPQLAHSEARPSFAASGTSSGVVPSSVSGVVPAAGRQGAMPSPSGSRSGIVSQVGVGPRVLIVEDDPIVRAQLEKILARRGAEIISASGPSEALYLLSSVEGPARRGALVILDVLMPGLDGPLFVKLLRSDDRLPDAPIVLVSALSAPILERTMTQWDADGFVLKSRGLLHVEGAIEGWFVRIAERRAGPSRSRRSQRPPGNTSSG